MAAITRFLLRIPSKGRVGGWGTSEQSSEHPPCKEPVGWWVGWMDGWMGHKITVSRTPSLSSMGRWVGRGKNTNPCKPPHTPISVGLTFGRYSACRLLVDSSVVQRDLRCDVAKVAPGNGDRIGRDFGRAVTEALAESKEEGGLPWENGFVRKFAHITSHFQGEPEKKPGLRECRNNSLRVESPQVCRYHDVWYDRSI